MRLIDADKLKTHYSWWTDETKELFDTIINLQPTIEAEPIRHGHWEWVDTSVYGNPYGSYKCDCGNYMPHKTNYCPNCGAKMDEVTE